MINVRRSSVQFMQPTHVHTHARRSFHCRRRITEHLARAGAMNVSGEPPAPSLHPRSSSVTPSLVSPTAYIGQSPAGNYRRLRLRTMTDGVVTGFRDDLSRCLWSSLLTAAAAVTLFRISSVSTGFCGRLNCVLIVTATHSSWYGPVDRYSIIIQSMRFLYVL